MSEDRLTANEPVDAIENGPLTAGSSAVMDLLAQHVPLALLADLAPADGPVSQEILETEGLPEDAWWDPQGGTGEDLTVLGGSSTAPQAPVT